MPVGEGPAEQGEVQLAVGLRRLRGTCEALEKEQGEMLRQQVALRHLNRDLLQTHKAISMLYESQEKSKAFPLSPSKPTAEISERSWDCKAPRRT
jgi:hypothetical protein